MTGGDTQINVALNQYLGGPRSKRCWFSAVGKVNLNGKWSVDITCDVPEARAYSETFNDDEEALAFINEQRIIWKNKMKEELKVRW